MKIKIEDLTNEQLDEWVARAQGFKESDFDSHDIISFNLNETEWYYCLRKDGTSYFELDDGTKYSPTANPAQWAELILEFDVEIQHTVDGKWARVVAANKKSASLARDKSLPVAICRAVVASVYGDEVEVSDD